MGIPIELESLFHIIGPHFKKTNCFSKRSCFLFPAVLSENKARTNQGKLRPPVWYPRELGWDGLWSQIRPSHDHLLFHHVFRGCDTHYSVRVGPVHGHSRPVRTWDGPTVLELGGKPLQRTVLLRHQVICCLERLESLH